MVSNSNTIYIWTHRNLNLFSLKLYNARFWKIQQFYSFAKAFNQKQDSWLALILYLQSL